MDHDVAIFRGVGALLAHDLNQAVAPFGGWRIEVSDDFVVSVSAGERHEQVVITGEVEDPSFYNVGVTIEEKAEALEVEAADALAYELFEILDLWQITGPRCREHHVELDVCIGVWYCSAEPGHDVCLVGQLATEHVTVTP